MRRKALILACDTKDLSTSYDAANWNDFLTSDKGGAWEDNEIITLKNPVKADITSKLHSIQSSFTEYLLIIFAGHGGINKITNEQVFSINKHEDILLKDLCDIVNKELIIADTCSSFFIESESRAYLQKSFASLNSSRSLYRVKYNERISTVAAGTTYLISSGINQTAQDDSDGGKFTKIFLSCARESSEKIYDIKTAYDDVVKIMPSTQQPRLSNGRRMNASSYPIAVNL